MSNFYSYFTEDIGQVFNALWGAIGALFNFLNYLFNFPMRMNIIKSHSSNFDTYDWIMLLIANTLTFLSFHFISRPLSIMVILMFLF